MSDWLKDLEDRSYKTYLARLQASKRLKSREHSWNTALISLSVGTTVAAVALLVYPKIFGPHGDVLMVCVSVVALAASLIVPSLNYSRRARDMFSNYRRIQRLSSEIERARKTSVKLDSDEAKAYFETYQALLDESENHTAADFARVSVLTSKTPLEAAAPEASSADGKGAHAPTRRVTPTPPTSGEVGRETALSLLPYVTLVVPIGLLARVIVWIFGG